MPRSSWGKAIYPKTSSEELERIKLLSQENAQLRAELASEGKSILGDVKINADGLARQNPLQIFHTVAPEPAQLKNVFREQLEPRLARTENVRSALVLVELGETPLGIVYETDVDLPHPRLMDSAGVAERAVSVC